MRTDFYSDITTFRAFVKLPRLRSYVSSRLYMQCGIRATIVQKLKFRKRIELQKLRQTVYGIDIAHFSR